MKVIVTGSTGMVGKGVLLECLDDPGISEALSISRSEPQINHPKLRILIHKDFSDFSGAANRLEGYDACYLCMGVSAAGMSEEKYRTITYDYTISLARTLHQINPGITCTYVSGQGTDSSEKGRIMWARVKGKTENALLNMGFKQAFMFRPGAIIPLRGIKSATRAYQFIYDYFLWAVKLFKKLSPSSVVNTTDIGRAMINITRNGFSEKILGPPEILKAANNAAKG